MPIEVDPIAPVVNDGYYVRRVDLLDEMGQEVFDGEIKLDPDLAQADESIVAEKIKEADDAIDLIAMDVGLSLATTGAGAGIHFLRSDIPDPPATDADRYEQIAFGIVRKQGAKLARALVRSLRPDAPDEPRTALTVIGSPPPAQNTDPSGGYTRQKNSALKSIREALSALMYRRDLTTAQPDDDILSVGWNDDGRRGRCRRVGYLPPGVDPDVLF